MIDFNFWGENPFEEDLFLSTKETKRIIFQLEKSIEKLKENNITYDYVNNHSKVILINSKEGKYVIETSSNFNENPKIEQFIITRSAEVYNYYITTFEKIGLIKGV